MTDYTKLQTKWATLAPGTTQQKLDVLNQATATQAKPAIVPVQAVVNAFVYADLIILTPAQLSILTLITQGGGGIDASVGSNVRATLLAIFGQGTATRTALQALVAGYDGAVVPWWQANGYPRPFDLGDIASAGLN